MSPDSSCAAPTDGLGVKGEDEYDDSESENRHGAEGFSKVRKRFKP